MSVLRLGCLVAASALLGCGGGGDDGGTTGPPPGGNQTLGSIVLNVPSLSLQAGNSTAITVVAYDTENAVISNPGSPTFSSASASIAEVDAQGNVLAVSAGSTQVNVLLTRGSVTKTASLPVTVTGSLPANAAVDVSAGQAFLPSAVIIQHGGTVTWTFGSLEHTVTFGQTTGVPSNIPASYSTSANRTFNTAGNFSYVCTIHAGMSGQVVVR